MHPVVLFPYFPHLLVNKIFFFFFNLECFNFTCIAWFWAGVYNDFLCKRYLHRWLQFIFFFIYFSVVVADCAYSLFLAIGSPPPKKNLFSSFFFFNLLLFRFYICCSTLISHSAFAPLFFFVINYLDACRYYLVLYSDVCWDSFYLFLALLSYRLGDKEIFILSWFYQFHFYFSFAKFTLVIREITCVITWFVQFSISSYFI